MLGNLFPSPGVAPKPLVPWKWYYSSWDGAGRAAAGGKGSPASAGSQLPGCLFKHDSWAVHAGIQLQKYDGGTVCPYHFISIYNMNIKEKGEK